MDEQDQYESLGLDDSVEDDRGFDQIMADRRAAEAELETRDARASHRKLPQLLHDQGPAIIWHLYVLNFLYALANFCSTC